MKSASTGVAQIRKLSQNRFSYKISGIEQLTNVPLNLKAEVKSSTSMKI